MRLFGTLLFIEPLFDEEALIAKLPLNMMKINFPTPEEILMRKRVEKEAAKAAAAVRAVEAARAPIPPLFPLIESSPEPSNMPEQPPAKKQKEDEVNLEVNLPPGISHIHNKKLGVQIIRHLITDVDMDTVNDGWIQDHLDEFSWDGLKVVELRERIRELKATDREHTEKLLEIERKFKDVRASADDVIQELQTLNRITKEGAEIIKSMVERFDKVKAENNALRKSIMHKDVDIIGLVTRIMGEHEKATLKVRYKLLKEYKRPSCRHRCVVKIELYEESLAEAEASTSAPRTTIEPLTLTVPSTIDELNPVTFKPQTIKKPRDDPLDTEKAAEH
ncbi:hypothetical protein TIFTF001_048727 [Ficus carica]|uniref:Uncharacterized protein n=1 Tax=Ficus carica TaxID=3494 RepID=A0AA87YWF2_FICCA|nr:hypothetical protein TIFTF001_048727 [Ficus carica]